MSAKQRPRSTRELRYEFGFKPPSGDTIVCGSFQEAQFFVSNGAVLLMREVEVRVGGWEEIKP